MRKSLLMLLCILALTHGSQARDAQKRAEELLQKAREFSDIRSLNAPPFRLRATFTLGGSDLDQIEGTFAEVWVSNSQWRRETVLRDFRRVELGGVNRLWRLDDGKGEVPLQASRLPGLVQIFPSRFSPVVYKSIVEIHPSKLAPLGFPTPIQIVPEDLSTEFETIAARGQQDPATDCAVTKAVGPRKLRSAFCFDKRSGAMVERVSPEILAARTADYSCRYTAFIKFGTYYFPRKIQCKLDGRQVLRVDITEISAIQVPDAALFNPPTDATAFGSCPSKPEPPTPVLTRAPRFPANDKERNTPVIVSYVVDDKGKTQAVKVVNSGDKPLDEASVQTVQSWEFKPALCNGEAVGTQMVVEFIYGTR